MVVARPSGRVRRVPGPGGGGGAVGRGGWLGGGGAADVHGGGGGVGGDVAGGVTERLSGLDLVGAVSVSVGGQARGGDGGQGCLVGVAAGGGGQGRGGGAGADGGDQGAAGGGEGQVPGLDGLPGAGTLWWRASQVPDRGPTKVLAGMGVAECQENAECSRRSSRTRPSRWSSSLPARSPRWPGRSVSRRARSGTG